MRRAIDFISASICGVFHIIKCILMVNKINKYITYLNLVVRIPKDSVLKNRTIFFIVNTLLDLKFYIKGVLDINISHRNGSQPVSIHILKNMKNLYLKGNGKYPHLYNIYFRPDATYIKPVLDI